MVSYSMLERPAHARQQAHDHRRAEGRARLPGLRGDRLAGDRSDGARRLQPGDRDRARRRHRHGDGAERVPRLHHAPQGAGRRGARPAGAHRRRRPPHPEAEGALQAVGAAVHRPGLDRGDRLARPSRGRARCRAQEPGRAQERQAGAAPEERRARSPVRAARRQHGRAVRRLVGRLARPARRHHARHHHPQGDGEGRRRRAHRLIRRTRRARRRPTSSSRSSARIPTPRAAAIARSSSFCPRTWR